MRVVTWLVVAVALWLPAGTAMAETFEAGMAAYEAEDYAKAYEVWKPLAEAGDPRAQYWVALMYVDGIAVVQDHMKAREWLIKAARQTDDAETMHKATYSLGYMLEAGWGGAADLEKAECLYRVSASNGNATAQFSMCRIITNKPGFNFALEWCERSAMQGYPLALAFVGKIRLINPFRDKAEGYSLLFVAARKGDEEARRILDQDKTLKSPEILDGLVRGARLAEKWLPRYETAPEQPKSIPPECWP